MLHYKSVGAEFALESFFDFSSSVFYLFGKYFSDFRIEREIFRTVEKPEFVNARILGQLGQRSLLTPETRDSWGPRNP